MQYKSKLMLDPGLTFLGENIYGFYRLFFESPSVRVSLLSLLSFVFFLLIINMTLLLVLEPSIQMHTSR